MRCGTSKIPIKSLVVIAPDRSTEVVRVMFFFCVTLWLFALGLVSCYVLYVVLFLH